MIHNIEKIEVVTIMGVLKPVVFVKLLKLKQCDHGVGLGTDRFAVCHGFISTLVTYQFSF